MDPMPEDERRWYGGDNKIATLTYDLQSGQRYEFKAFSREELWPLETIVHAFLSLHAGLQGNPTPEEFYTVQQKEHATEYMRTLYRIAENVQAFVTTNFGDVPNLQWRIKLINVVNKDKGMAAPDAQNWHSHTPFTEAYFIASSSDATVFYGGGYRGAHGTDGDDTLHEVLRNREGVLLKHFGLDLGPGNQSHPKTDSVKHEQKKLRRQLVQQLIFGRPENADDTLPTQLGYRGIPGAVRGNDNVMYMMWTPTEHRAMPHGLEYGGDGRVFVRFVVQFMFDAQRVAQPPVPANDEHPYNNQHCTGAREDFQRAR